MLTRGVIIGKIVDDFASLSQEIEMRNKLGQFDLSKFCEDFFKEVLNITYNLNLSNLNKTRSNFPGLDLGDNKNKIAYQVTSQYSSNKINETLRKIGKDQAEIYKKILVFIIGQKQGKYSIEADLSKTYDFTPRENIQDINSLLREIVLLDSDKLDILNTLFHREFRKVKIELEPIDSSGNFESSYFNTLEKKPSEPPKNGVKFLGKKSEKGYENEKISWLDCIIN